MNIEGSVALVTGANRGIGLAGVVPVALALAQEALVDEPTRHVEAALPRDQELLYPGVIAGAGTAA